jgi:hypothetical protein
MLVYDITVVEKRINVEYIDKLRHNLQIIITVPRNAEFLNQLSA